MLGEEISSTDLSPVFRLTQILCVWENFLLNFCLSFKISHFLAKFGWTFLIRSQIIFKINLQKVIRKNRNYLFYHINHDNDYAQHWVNNNIGHHLGQILVILERLRNPVRQVFSYEIRHVFIWFTELWLIVHWITLKTCVSHMKILPYGFPQPLYYIIPSFNGIYACD